MPSSVFATGDDALTLDIILNLGPADSNVRSRLEYIGKAYSPPARVTVI